MTTSSYFTYTCTSEAGGDAETRNPPSPPKKSKINQGHIPEMSWVNFWRQKLLNNSPLSLQSKIYSCIENVSAENCRSPGVYVFVVGGGEGAPR